MLKSLKVGKFFAELKRRKVYNVSAAYVVAAWVMALGAAELFPYFGIPDWAVRLVVAVAILGLPAAIVLAWAFEVTPGGVVRDADARALRNSNSGSTTRIVAPTAISITVEGRDADKPREFNTDFTIGRDESCEVCVADERVSRKHAHVFYEKGQWWIRDMSSRNGTFKDDVAIDCMLLQETTVVRIAPDGPLVRLRAFSGKTTIPAG